jgi:hypothetical protein
LPEQKLRLPLGAIEKHSGLPTTATAVEKKSGYVV